MVRIAITPRMLEGATTAFEVDGQWYEGPYGLIRAFTYDGAYRRTNREVVEAMKAAGCAFKPKGNFLEVGLS